MAYSREELMAAVSAQMPEKRWKHTLGVMETSVKLSKRYGADPQRAELAAILHDVAKYWPAERQRAVIADNGLTPELLEYDVQLWHAEVGAFVAETEFGIGDAGVLDAIRYHTSGRPGMSLLEKVVCLADYTEPGRDFKGVDEMRKLAETSLDEALLAGLDGTIIHLVKKQKKVFPLTLSARNDLIKIIGGE